MFCVNCGSKLEESANFCTNCGTSVSKLVNNNGIEEKNVKSVEDTVVQLTVKPTFKFGYIIMPVLILCLFFVVFVSFGFFMLSIEAGIISFLICLGISLIIAIIETIFTKKQYEKLEYDFYKTKVIYIDSFLSLSEKEVKYKYIREATMRQSLIQRWFNVGNIVLYTNAETGYSNGISISNVENVREVYKQVKDIVGI